MKPLISELNIEHYRGIRDLDISDLGQINVFAGVNNSGKTSILETIGLLSNPLERFNLTKWAFMRLFQHQDLNKKIVDYLEFLFTDAKDLKVCATVKDQKYDVSYQAESIKKSTASGELYKVIKITAELLKNASEYKKESFSFRNNSRGNYKSTTELFKTECITTNGNFYHNCVNHVSESMLKQKKGLLLEVIQSFDTDIADIMLKNDDILLQSNSIGVQPLFNYGSGLQKAVLLAACLLAAENNVILIDEIDSTMNLTAFQPVFNWFVHKCRELNVQAFVTTHSLEAIDAILETSNSEQDDDIRIITLRKTPKSHRIIAQIRTGEQARSDRERFAMEMRV